MEKIKKVFYYIFIAVLFCCANNIDTRNVFAGSDFAGGDGSLSSPYQIDTCARLQLISTLGIDDPNIHFVLTQDIDCSATSISNSSDPSYDASLYNSGAGFNPIGSLSHPFKGFFNGNNYTISNLYINRSDTQNIGLFGYISSTSGEVLLKNFSLTGANISGNANTGGIVGKAVGDDSNWLYISGVSFRGNVTGAVGQVGGLVGTADYLTMILSNAQGVISGANGTYNIGGLVGAVDSSGNTGFYIVRSYFSGDILETVLSGSGNGGIIGSAKCIGGSVCQIDWSYADIDMNVLGDHNGGLIGLIEGSSSTNINQSYTKGSIYIDVIGDDSGGLVGETSLSSGSLNIANSYSEININGEESVDVKNVGGLIGHSQGAGSVLNRNCYSKGSLNGGSSIGGLYGKIVNSLSSFNSFSTNSISGSNLTGGFAGEETTYGVFSNNWWYNISSTYDANYSNDVGTDYSDVEVAKASSATDFYDPNHQVYNQNDNKWDYSNIWLARDNNYPILKWQESDANHESDTTPPTFSDLPDQDTVINIVEGQIIYSNPFTIKVRPIDEDGISKTEFYVDDNLICVNSQADANGVYDCVWDTAKYHSQVKVYAYDTANNRSEALIRNSTVDPRIYLTELPATGVRVK